MDNFLFYPDITDDQHTRATSCCGTLSQKYKGMPESLNDLGEKKLESNVLEIRERCVYTGEYA
jgi:hypothetical protein